MAAAAALLFGALAWFVSVRPLARGGAWRLARSWYEASFAVALLFAFFGSWILATGYTPTRYASHRVPRASGLGYLAMAVLPAVVGLAFYLAEKAKRSAPRP